MTGRGQAGRSVVAVRGGWVGNNDDRRVWAKWGKGARRGINPAGGILAVDVCGNGGFIRGE